MSNASLHQEMTLQYVRDVSITDLMEEVEDYENSSADMLDEDDHIHYQSCKDAIVIKSLTGR